MVTLQTQGAKVGEKKNLGAGWVRMEQLHSLQADAFQEGTIKRLILLETNRMGQGRMERRTTTEGGDPQARNNPQ